MMSFSDDASRFLERLAREGKIDGMGPKTVQGMWKKDFSKIKAEMFSGKLWRLRKKYGKKLSKKSGMSF